MVINNRYNLDRRQAILANGNVISLGLIPTYELETILRLSYYDHVVGIHVNVIFPIPTA